MTYDKEFIIREFAIIEEKYDFELEPSRIALIVANSLNIPLYRVKSFVGTEKMNKYVRGGK